MLRKMFKIPQRRHLFVCCHRRFVRTCKHLPYKRQISNDVMKRPPLNRKKSSNFKPGLLAGAVLVGGIFVKLHNTAKSGHENQLDYFEEESPNGEALSLSQAVDLARDIVQRKKDETGSPGVTIAVSVDGKHVWTEGFGYSDVENRLKCTPDTIFRIASISKSITMTAVAKLWESGDLDLDKPVQFYVPEFPEKTWNGEKVIITTRQLLSHLGGIRHYHKDYMNKQGNTNNHDDKKKQKTNLVEEDKGTPNQRAEKTSQETKDEMQLDEYYIQKHYTSVLDSLELFKSDPLVHKPDKYLYTTHGWTLISAVVEKAAKKSFEKFLREMLDELGLENTHLEEHKPLVYNRGRHYVKNEKGRLENAPYVDLSYKWAGGGLISNVLDLTKFGNAMLYSFQMKAYSTSSTPASMPFIQSKDLNAVSGNRDTLPLTGYLKPETMKMMWTPIVKLEPKPTGMAGSGYGLGWRVSSKQKEHEFCKDQQFYVSHTGAAIGASSVLLILPTETASMGKEEEHVRNKQSTNIAPSCSHAKGVVVAIITNMTSVGLNKTAYDVARIFERVYLDK